MNNVILILIIFFIILVNCYNPLDFEKFEEIKNDERINEIKNVSELTNFSVKLEWETKEFEDFLQYRIYRSQSLPVSENSTLIFSANDRKKGYFYDYMLEPETNYYYRLYTYYEGNLKFEGNLIEITTKELPARDFIIYVDYSNKDIYKMSIDGTNKIRLFPSGQSPAWHPKGICFAYSFWDSENWTEFKIYLGSLDGLYSIPICDIYKTFSRQSVNNMSWSRDGKYLFIQFSDLDIYKINMENRTNNFFMKGDNICCSPNNDEILVQPYFQYSSTYDYSGQLIKTYGISADPFTNGSYSKSGDKFAYIYYGDVFVYDFQQGIVTRTIEGNFYEPFFSLDGLFIYFINENTLYKINADGTGEKIFIANYIESPDWSVLSIQ